MIIKPVRHSKKEPRIIFYKTGVIVFNESAVKKLGILGEHRFIFNIDESQVKLIFDEDGFKFVVKNLERNVYRINSRQACSLVIKLFGKENTKHISFITEKDESANISLNLDSIECIIGDSVNTSPKKAKKVKN